MKTDTKVGQHNFNNSMRTDRLQWRFSPYLLWRRGSLPFDALRPLLPVKTWELLDRLEAESAAHEGLQTALTQWLHSAIPATSGQDRKELLTLKRDIHNGRLPRERAISMARHYAGVDEAILFERWLAQRSRALNLMCKAEAMLQAECAAARGHLVELARHGDLLRGVQLSGRSLRENVRLFAETAASRRLPEKRQRRLQDTIVSFLYRMSLKTSPFGSFTQVGAQPFTGAKAGVAGATMRRSCLSRLMLDWIEAQLLMLESCREHLPIRRNSTLKLHEGHIELFTRGQNGTAQMFGGERFVRVQCSEALQTVLAALDVAPQSRAKLVRKLATVGVDVARSQSFLERLIEAGVIERSLGVSDQDPGYIRSMIDALGRVPGEQPARCAVELTAMAEIEEAFSTASVDRRDHLLDELQTRLARISEVVGVTGFPGDSEVAPVFEDVGSTGVAASWDGKLVETARENLALLQRVLAVFDDSTCERLGLYTFFVATYGLDARVPLMDLYRAFARLDPATASRLMRGDDNPEVAEIHRLRVAYWQYLKRRLDAGEGAPELALSGDWLRRFADAIPSRIAPWRSAAFHLQKFRRPDGHAGLVLGGVGPGHGARFSRFASFLGGIDPESDWSLKAALIDELQRSRGYGPKADLNAVLGVNTNLHPPLTSLEVVYPRCRSDPSTPSPLGLGEIYVTTDAATGQLRLLGPDMSPFELVPLNFLYPVAGPSLYRFLFLFSPFISVRCKFWDGYSRTVSLAGPGPHRFPRLTLGVLVLCRSQTTLPLDTVLSELRHIKDDLPGLIAVERWRVATDLPQECFYTIAGPMSDTVAEPPTWTDELRRWALEARSARWRKPHYLDFRNPFLTRILLRQMRGAGRGTITFQECLPTTANYNGHAELSSAEELVIELNCEMEE